MPERRRARSLRSSERAGRRCRRLAPTGQRAIGADAARGAWIDANREELTRRRNRLRGGVLAPARETAIAADRAVVPPAAGDRFECAARHRGLTHVVRAPARERAVALDA